MGLIRNVTAFTVSIGVWVLAFPAISSYHHHSQIDK